MKRFPMFLVGLIGVTAGVATGVHATQDAGDPWLAAMRSLVNLEEDGSFCFEHVARRSGLFSDPTGGLPLHPDELDPPMFVERRFRVCGVVRPQRGDLSSFAVQVIDFTGDKIDGAALRIARDTNGDGAADVVSVRKVIPGRRIVLGEVEGRPASTFTLSATHLAPGVLWVEYYWFAADSDEPIVFNQGSGPRPAAFELRARRPRIGADHRDDEHDD